MLQSSLHFSAELWTGWFPAEKRLNEHGLTFNLTYSPHCLLWHCASLLFQRMCRAQSSSDCRQLPIKVSTPQDSHQISSHVPGQRGSYGWIWRSAPKAVNAGAGRPASSLKLVFKDDVGLSWWFPDLGYIRSILKLMFWLFLICHIWDEMIHFNIGGLLNQVFVKILHLLEVLPLLCAHFYGPFESLGMI